MNKELVIAAYERPLDWLETIDKNIKITIYRKGDKSPSKYAETHIKINKGRCVHTFFNHLYTKYDILSDMTFFVQDDPFDHWENIIEVLNKQSWDKDYTLNINNNYYGFNISTVHHPFVLKKTSIFTDGYVLVTDGKGNPDHSGLEVDRYWEILFDEIKPEYYEFLPAGHFGITKNYVHNRSKDFYLKIKELLEEENDAPFIIERLECYIFDPKYKSKF